MSLLDLLLPFSGGYYYCMVGSESHMSRQMEVGERGYLYF